MAAGYSVAVVGATGAVGTELIKLLEERNFPLKALSLFAPRRSAGVEFQGEECPVQALSRDSFRGVDLAFFASESSLSREYAPQAVDMGCVVIDASPYYRGHRHVPLVVPEINAQRLKDHQGIIANPSSPTIQMVLVLSPLHKAAGIRRIVVSTYQAVSDAGETAVHELSEQIKALFNFREPHIELYPHQIAFNCLPHIDAFLANGYSQAEMQIAEETIRILEDTAVRMSVTAVHVPVFYGHCAAVHIETERKLTAQKARKILAQAPGVTVEDDPHLNHYPLAINAVGKDESLVGRIRDDISVEHGLAFWTACDNLRKGSALNAVQIAEHLIAH